MRFPPLATSVRTNPAGAGNAELPALLSSVCEGQPRWRGDDSYRAARLVRRHSQCGTRRNLQAESLTNWGTCYA